MFIAMVQEKPIIFRSVMLSIKDKNTVELSSVGVRNLMVNLSRIVDTKEAISSNPADTFEVLIGAGMEDNLNRAARAALSAAALAAGEDVSKLDAFVLGERELLEGVTNQDECEQLILNAVAFGYTDAVEKLLERNIPNKVLEEAVYIASECGRKGALIHLINKRARANFRGKVSLYILTKNIATKTSSIIKSEQHDAITHFEQTRIY